MDKQCEKCHQSYPADLNYSPHCGVWANPPSSPELPKPGTVEKGSSGEFMLDPLQPDPSSDADLAQVAADGSGVDEVIEIDWAADETSGVGMKAPPTPRPGQQTPAAAGPGPSGPPPER